MNFLKPATTDNYSTEFVPNVQANQTDLARWLDSTYVAITGTPPVRAKRYNRASFSMEEYDAGWAAISFNATHLGGVAAVGYQADLGFAPVQQGGGTGQGTNKVYVGWATSGGITASASTTSAGRASGSDLTTSSSVRLPNAARRGCR